MNALINFEKYYDIFRDISRIVHASVDVEEVLELVVWKTAEMFDAAGAFLRIVDLNTPETERHAAYGLEAHHLEQAPFAEYESIKELYRLRNVAIRNQVADNPRINNLPYLKENGIQTIIDIPLVLREDILGIIQVYLKYPIELTKEEMGFIGAVSETCACAIDKARMIEEQKSQYTHLALQTEKLSALGRMAAGIAHEINNPLAGILLFSTNMLKKTPKEGPINEGLEVIVRETQRCKSIIQALLEFSRDQEPKKLPTSINEIIEGALTILSNEFRLNHISVAKELSDGMPQLSLDANLMQQVFVNLLMNATEAMGENGTITVRSQMVPNLSGERIEIRDTGRGIPKDHLTKIFDPFFSTKKNGTGLGLAVSYGIIQRHDGHIQVSSEQGKGTCFTIEIPV